MSSSNQEIQEMKLANASVTKEELREALDQFNSSKPMMITNPYPVEEKKKESYYKILVRRKVILKGKMAPPGMVYIAVNVSGGKTKYENARLIPGGVGKKTESECAKYLIDQINDKYKTQIPYPDEH